MQGNVILKRGLFPETTAGLEARRFAFVYVDFDYYISTRDAIALFAPRINPGGVMVFDDYEWPQCPGVAEAIEQIGLEVEVPVPYLAVAKRARGIS